MDSESVFSPKNFARKGRKPVKCASMQEAEVANHRLNVSQYKRYKQLKYIYEHLEMQERGTGELWREPQ